MFCAGTVGVRPHVKLVVWVVGGACGPSGGRSSIIEEARHVLIRLLDTGQVARVELGVEHDVAKANLHGHVSS